MKKLILCVTVFIAVLHTAFSQEVVEQNPQVVRVKAKREIFDPAKNSLSTTIITSDEIKSMGVKNVGDVLKRTSGVNVVNQSGSSTISIRGARAEQVSVLINGQKINSTQGLGVDLSQYGVENIDRIEVIRGSAATRYGANSLGGVINIITKDRVDNLDGIEYVLRYGSFNTMIANGLVSKSFGKMGQGNLFVDGGVFYTKGDYSYDAVAGNGNTIKGKLPNNDLLRGSVRTGFGYKLNEKGDNINASISAVTEERGVAGSYSSTFFTGFSKARQEFQRYSADVSYENYSIPIFNLFLSANTLYQIKIYDGTKDTYPSWNKYNNVATEVNATLDREDSFGGNILTWQNIIDLSYKNAYFMSEPSRTNIFRNGKDVVRNTVSISYTPTLNFLMYDESSTGRITIMPAIRFDAAIGSGALTNKSYYIPVYSVGLMYTFDKERKYLVKGNFATGYRIPGFDDLYSENGGNINLKEETSLGGDAGFIINPNKIVRLEAMYFVSKVKDLITWTPSPTVQDPYRWTPSNVDNVFIQGVETLITLTVPIEAILSSIELNGSYTYQLAKASGFDGIAFVKNKKLQRSPEHTGNATLSYIYEGNDIFSGRINFGFQYVGERYNDLANTRLLKDFTTFDITGSIMLLDTISLEGGVKNILDTRYEYVYGFVESGREWYVNLSGRF